MGDPQAAVVTDAEGAATPTDPARRPRRWPTRVDAFAIIACLLLAGVVHNVGAALSPPYWLDEAWVAVAGKGSLTQLPWDTASTPIGWSLLVWLFPANGQWQRVVPLGFLAGSVAAGYLFGRALGWPSRLWSIVAGGMVAIGVVLLPAQQVRHDLKQYTADACLALLLLAGLAWTESGWSRRRAVVLGAGIVAGMLVSHTVAFVGVAILGGLLIVAALHRDWRRVAGLLPLCGLTALGMAFVYLVVDRPGRTGALSDYWAGYLPSPAQAPHYVIERLNQLQPVLGMPWPLFLALAAVGVVVVARLRRPATATALVLLPIGAFLAGIFKVYPLLDQRTSHYLLVIGAAAGWVGIAGLIALVARLTPARGRTLVAAGLVLVTVAGFVVADRHWLRFTGRSAGGDEDIRSQVAYVAAHRQPGDVVLVNLSGGYGFAYYWSADRPLFERGGVEATGWYVTYPASTDIVIAADRDAAAVNRSVQQAEALAGPTGRIWLVRTHVNPPEAAAWHSALAGRRLQSIRVGAEPVTLVTG